MRIHITKLVLNVNVHGPYSKADMDAALPVAQRLIAAYGMMVDHVAPSNADNGFVMWTDDTVDPDTRADFDAAAKALKAAIEEEVYSGRREVSIDVSAKVELYTHA